MNVLEHYDFPLTSANGVESQFEYAYFFSQTLLRIFLRFDFDKVTFF